MSKAEMQDTIAQPELPESWQPPKPEEPPAPLVVPYPQGERYETLAAWHSGSMSYAEHYRKVVQAHCEESLRAQYALRGEKVTEHRLEAQARLHPAYLAYLEWSLNGRMAWEKAFLAIGGLHG